MQSSSHASEGVHFHRDRTGPDRFGDLDDVDLNESVEFDITFLKPGVSHRKSAMESAAKSPTNPENVNLHHMEGDLGSSGAFDGTSASTSRAASYGYSSFNNLDETNEKEDDR